jgi:hypothetical protein
MENFLHFSYENPMFQRKPTYISGMRRGHAENERAYILLKDIRKNSFCLQLLHNMLQTRLIGD